MARRSERNFSKSKNFPHQTVRTKWMIQGRPTGKPERYYFRTEKRAKKAAADRNRQVTAFGSQTALPELERGIMFAKYQKKISKEAARRFWAIRP
jgi:hypothetical protein